MLAQMTKSGKQLLKTLVLGSELNNTIKTSLGKRQLKVMELFRLCEKHAQEVTRLTPHSL